MGVGFSTFTPRLAHVMRGRWFVDNNGGERIPDAAQHPQAPQLYQAAFPQHP